MFRSGKLTINRSSTWATKPKHWSYAYSRLEKPVEYALYEICHHNIGVITSVTLEIGTSVLIERNEHHIIPLIVHQAVPRDNLPEGYNRYRLISVDPQTDFETLLPELGARTFTINNKQQYNVRFARFKTDIPTRVDASTFGSPEIYTLKTINISKSGFARQPAGIPRALQRNHSPRVNGSRRRRRTDTLPGQGDSLRV